MPKARDGRGSRPREALLAAVRHSRSLDTLHDLPNHPRVELNGDHPLCPLEEVHRKVTRTGTDLQNDVCSFHRCPLNDPLRRKYVVYFAAVTKVQY